jgi:hypothetical protein
MCDESILFMSLEPQLVRLKQLIFAVDDVTEQKRLIGTIIDEYKKESARAEENAHKYATLELEHATLKQEHLQLQLAQAKKSPEFVLHNGVLWKRIGAGFEQFPYCLECGYLAVMSPVTHRISGAKYWQRSSGHKAPRTKPPTAN